MATISLSHYLQPWILPPGLSILLLLIGFFLCWVFPRIAKIIIALGILSLWCFSMPYVAYHLVGALQDQYAVLQPELLDNAKEHDAIVVLGGGDAIAVEYNNKHTISDTTLHRLNYAVYLNQKTHIPIIVSGGKPDGAVDSEADLMANYLKENNGIITTLKEDRSLNTADESTFLSTLFKQDQIHKIYLVTNAWHMPRSMFIFQCSGVNVTPAPMGYFVYGPGYAFISFLPNIDALYASFVAMHEYMGLFWYRVHYGNQCTKAG